MMLAQLERVAMGVRYIAGIPLFYIRTFPLFFPPSFFFFLPIFLSTPPSTPHSTPPSLSFSPSLLYFSLFLLCSCSRSMNNNETIKYLETNQKLSQSSFSLCQENFSAFHNESLFLKLIMKCSWTRSDAFTLTCRTFITVSQCHHNATEIGRNPLNRIYLESYESI